jgi:hypothetical protein
MPRAARCAAELWATPKAGDSWVEGWDRQLINVLAVLQDFPALVRRSTSSRPELGLHRRAIFGAVCVFTISCTPNLGIRADAAHLLSAPKPMLPSWTGTVREMDGTPRHRQGFEIGAGNCSYPSGPCEELCHCRVWRLSQSCAATNCRFPFL